MDMHACMQCQHAGAAQFCTPTHACMRAAGVVGLACARALALAGRDVIVLEQANTFGTETSSRHSEGA